VLQLIFVVAVDGCRLRRRLAVAQALCCGKKAMSLSQQAWRIITYHSIFIFP
jgi:hypothetical protein